MASLAPVAARAQSIEMSEVRSSVEVGLSMKVGSSVEVGLSMKVGSSVEVGLSVKVGLSVEVGLNVESVCVWKSG